MSYQASAVDSAELSQMVEAARRRQLSLLPGSADEASTAKPHGLTGRGSIEFAEAFRRLALSVTRLAESQPLSTILVMGAYPGDGRTTTVANLGIALAEMGKHVLAVESDPGTPGLGALLGAGSQPQPVSRYAALSVVPTSFQDLLLVRSAPGAEPANEPRPDSGSSLWGRLGSMFRRRPEPSDHRATQLALPMLRAVESLIQGPAGNAPREAITDFLILDSPPCQRYADAFFLAPRVDGVLYVVRQRRQDVPGQRAIQAQLGLLGAKILGVVYNEG